MTPSRACAVPLTIRVSADQSADLKRLPENINTGALVRVLLKLYFDGAIPQAFVLARIESTRSQKASRSGGRSTEQAA